jgi:DNA replication protein DnaC
VSRGKLLEIPERFRDCTFESYHPQDSTQLGALSQIKDAPENSYFLHGPYGSGKTHLLLAQYRTLVLAGIPCDLRTTAQLLNEIQRMEFDSDFLSPVFLHIRCGRRYHLFWDDLDKFKMTDFRSQELFDLIDTIYRRNLSITITSNFTLKELAEFEKVHPSFIRRIDEICRVLEV